MFGYSGALPQIMKKCGVDYFDFYLLHALDGERWDAVLKMGVLDFLLEERKAAEKAEKEAQD